MRMQLELDAVWWRRNGSTWMLLLSLQPFLKL